MRGNLYVKTGSEKSGRGEWIRTTDLTVPNRALYQAEPRPDKGAIWILGSGRGYVNEGLMIEENDTAIVVAHLEPAISMLAGASLSSLRISWICLALRIPTRCRRTHQAIASTPTIPMTKSNR
jgi:hypothetical protein